MESFKQFLRTIARKVLLPPSRLDAIAKIDPTHIYVENIRAVFGFSTKVAEKLLQFAAHQGLLERRVEVMCPDKTAIAEAPTVALLPPTVNCLQEVDGNYEEVAYETKNLSKVHFYTLKQEEVI